jgi:PAS domain S-box-containing protein
MTGTISKWIALDRGIQGLPVAYSEVDNEGIIRMVNEAGCLLFGAKAEELVGRPVWEFVPSAQAAQDRAEFLAMIGANVDPPVIRRSLYTPQGGYRMHEIHRRMLRDEDGNAIGVSRAMIDVSEVEFAHEETRRAKLWLESVVEAIPQAVVVTDSLGFVRFANPSAERVTGWTARELVGFQIEKGMPILRAVSTSGRKLSFRTALEEIWNGDVEILNRDGQTVSTWLSVCPILEKETGYTNGVVVVFRSARIKATGVSAGGDVARVDQVAEEGSIW